MGHSEYTPLTVNANYTPHESEYKLYTKRWYILFLFSLLSASQSNSWITYGAVGETTKELYHTSWANVNFLAATGPIAFIPLSSLTSWVIGEYGLRVASLAAAVLCAAGAGIRCFATADTYWLVILAQFLNSASGPVVMNAPPAVSATWFGVNERTFATALGTLANAMGSATGFLLGLSIRNTVHLKHLLYYEAIFGLVLLVAMAIYFPAEPPTPPSATSAAKKVVQTPWQSWMVLMRESGQVIKCWDGMCILLSAGLSSGANGGWGAMLVLILAKYYSQWDIQWLGLFNIVGGVIGGLLIGKVHDHFRHFKVLMCFFFFLGSGIFVAFSLATQRTFVCTFMEIMALNVAAGFCLNAIFPVSYEALIEVTYPVKEETSAGLLSLVNNIACLILLIVGDYETGNYINWGMAGLCLACFVMVLMTRERYLRTNIDLK